jgi:hypothetical protein
MMMIKTGVIQARTDAKLETAAEQLYANPGLASVSHQK